jgi:hypothetical protein
VANGDQVSYLIEDGTEFEMGVGTYTSSGTLFSRDTVRRSSNGGSKINATSAALVYIDAGAEDLPHAGSTMVTSFTEANDLVPILQSGVLKLITAANALAGRVNEVALQVFTASDTYNKPADLLQALVITTGGGGGGGGGDASSATGDGKAAGGGAAGGTCVELLAAGSIGATETVTIGAAGTAGSTSGGNGGVGGNSSFGAFHTANGGAGGTGTGSTTGVISGAGGDGGVPTGGLLNIEGGDGNQGFGTANEFGLSGAGGASFWGGGGKGVVRSTAGTTAGNAGTAYGSGGSGACNFNSTTGAAGGAGAAGVCIVLEFKS